MDKRLIIIDGNSIINRAFYALPQTMDNKEGLHTNAIYGFTTMLFKMIELYKPTHISVAFDRKAPTFRHKEYSEYKAGRKKMPQELFEQMQPLKELLDAFKIERFEIDGYEADDIIGTISKEAENKGFDVFIVTGDKDAIQLASHKTTTLITKKGVADVEEYNYDSVIEKYEMTPTQFIDLKGLMGDKSDNIPGVPGVGEKTGIKLLKQFGNIENLIENTDELKGSIKKKIEENKDEAIHSKWLATIVRDVPIEFDLDKMIFGDFNIDEVVEKFQFLKFNSLIKRLMEISGKENIDEKSDINIDYSVDLKTLIKAIKEKKKFAFKTVTKTGNILEKNIIAMYITLNGDNIYYIPESEIDNFKDILEDEKINKYGYNMKEDYIAFMPYGIKLNNMSFDIAIAEYLIDSTSTNTSECASIAMKYLMKSIKTKEELLGKGVKAKRFEDLDRDNLSNYISSVLYTVINAIPKMEEEIKNTKIEELFNDVEMPLVEVLANMEYTGIKVDENMLSELGVEFTKIISSLEKEIFEYAGEEFNINSPKQLGVILFEKLDLPVIKKTKTGYSTNAEVLEKLKDKHPIIDKIGEYRQIVKLNSTYVEGLTSLINPIDKRIHSTFNQTITTTGRISSTEPNLQNIPVRMEIGRRLRAVFVSDEEKRLVDADYSQVELRVLAHMSEDPHMIEAFEHGEDIHRKTASQVFNVDIKDVTPELRSAAKAVNFGIIYGKTDYGLSEDLNIPVPKAKEYIESYFGKYEKIKEFMDNVIETAEKEGYSKTMFNRRRYIPEIKSKNFMERNRGKRAAMNAPIQGSAADIIKIAMVNVFRRLEKENLNAKLILQVHDELIVEAPIDELKIVEKIVREEMENAVEMKVKLTVDLNTGVSWYETK
ncbi:DNA polymerase I [Peptacetobacter sp.]|uniref:DNA polymerase I n=1 Tax=Peptacetobacter sp. TaxID=2991975 RepID=UPI002601AE8E|nr:DNA polymerase I [Peptacetobacter sp.]